MMGGVDWDVFERLVMAGHLDGAIHIAGSNATVVNYAVRVTPSAGKLTGQRSGGKTRAVLGTKRAAALAFAQSASVGSFAITASSDGPVRLVMVADSAPVMTEVLPRVLPRRAFGD